MSDSIYYKVLLVDDNKALGASLQPQAERYGLDLQQCECWEDAQQELSNKNKFLEWDAIILDANCIYKKNESADMGFLPLALGELRELFGRHGSSIPWYVYTVGAGEKVEKKDFDSIMTIIKRYTRDDESWGEMLYYKNGIDEDKLFQSISEVAPKRTRNQIKQQYQEVFDAMEDFLSSNDENVMIEILTALHFPESRIDFNPDKEYNRLRKILESLFHSANQIGLLPDEFLTKEGQRNLTDASRYMAGKDPKHVQFRYGDKGEYIFPPIIADSVSNILSVTNTGSHIEVRQSNLLFGYALQLCDVIVWFCDYAKSHSDKEANLAKCKMLKKETESIQEQKPVIEEYEGKTFLLEQDEKGNLHCSFCMVSYHQHQKKLGKMVRLHNVEKNSQQKEELRDIYPYFAKKVEVIDM